MKCISLSLCYLWCESSTKVGKFLLLLLFAKSRVVSLFFTTKRFHLVYLVSSKLLLRALLLLRLIVKSFY